MTPHDFWTASPLFYTMFFGARGLYGRPLARGYANRQNSHVLDTQRVTTTATLAEHDACHH